VSPVDAAATNVGAGNWKGLGMWAWLLFRIAGIVLVVYLFAHIGVISTARLGGRSTLNSAFDLFDHPLFVLLDLLLVWAVLFHALNGVRILLMDFGLGIHRHKAVFWGCMAIAVLTLGLFALKAFAYIAAHHGGGLGGLV
jgi:succinate dehydrogenase / fumarate reductase, cytochrome b subunit